MKQNLQNHQLTHSKRQIKQHSNHSSASSGKKIKLKRQDSPNSERRRDVKHNVKASYFTKARKVNEGILSDEDSIGNIELCSSPLKDALYESNTGSFSNEEEQLLFDDDLILDSNHDLPIRKA
jgi:hypothetical protein